jgi:uncharacterized iron-regulated protein
MQPDHKAILDQFVEMAAQCSTVEGAEAYAKRYREQYQNQVAYLDNVVLPIVAAFEKRAEELRGDGA